MYLKRLELSGFKTFADRTEIEFIPGMMAVVGPNGSGKSNLTDAVRYVLGEQSVKALRAARLEELIFVGVPERKAAQMCEVTAVFDNSDGTLPIDFAEVALKRSTSRDGESRYYINNVSCRLKDIQEVLMGSGIGPGSFFILGNREIDMVLSSDPRERRLMLEETAGTNRYKFRRREAMRKLEQAEQNLLRLGDVCAEVERGVKESKKALDNYERYKKAQDTLKNTELALVYAEMKKNREACEEASLKNERLKQSSAEADAEAVRLQSEIEELQQKLHAGLKEREGLQQAAADLKENLSFARATRDGLQKRVQQLETNIDEADKRCQNLLLRLDGKREEAAQLQNRIAADEELVLKARDEVDCVKDELAKLPEGLTGSGAELREKLRENESEQGRLRADREAGINSIAQFKERLEYLQGRLAEAEEAAPDSLDLEGRLASARSQLAASRRREAEISAELQKISGRMAEISSERSEWERRRRPLNMRVMELEGALEERIGMPQPVRAVMKWKVPGVLGVIGELIKVREGMETAIETAFGGRLYDIACRDRQVASGIIERLQRERIGRVTFWPLDLDRRSAEGRALPKCRGFIGYVLDLIEFSPELKGVLAQMAGQTAVMQTLDDALALYDLCRSWRPNLVTLRGEYLSASGAVTGGTAKNDKAGMLARARAFEEARAELRKAEKTLQALTAEEDMCRKKRTEAERLSLQIRNELRAEAAALEELEAEERKFNLERREQLQFKELLTAEKTSLEAKLHDLEEKLREGEARLEALASEWLELNLGLSLSAAQESGLAEKKSALQLRLKEAEASLSVAAEKLRAGRREKEKLQNAIEELQADLKLAEADKRRYEAGRQRNENEDSDLENAIGEKSAALSENSQLLAALSQRLEADNLELRRLRRAHTEAADTARRLGEELSGSQAQTANLQLRLRQAEYKWQELDSEGFDPGSVGKDFNVRQAGQKISELKSFLANFGSVNLGAREEYERLKARFDELQSQTADINGACANFKKIIAEMDHVLAVRFKEVFKAVNETFAKVFREIFGGGWAKLELCEPDNLLESGVEISACPPGKKLQSLTLFSSGERALSAIAFLFSLLTHKPSPIVMLDELDAPLDDANVEKIAHKMLSFAESSQFLVITHNRKTMEFAQRLYGVTAETPGISSVLSVKLAEAASE
ncbi:chromosome segregation protein SMC [bacterium]|nr:chromosome segregation protein SMC [bacterium]